MSRLLACVAHGHLFYVGSNVVAFDVVGVVQVVAEVVLRKVERDEEACVVWRESRCPDECDCEFGTTRAMSVYDVQHVWCRRTGRSSCCRKR
jgi:hypothetical protein